MLYSESTIALRPRIEEVTKSFFDQHGFSYFQYLRCYEDGRYSLLTNDTRLLEEFANQPPDTQLIYSSFNEEQKSKYAYWFLWDEMLPKEPVQLAKQKLDIHNGITLLRRSKNYYDMIAVALPKHLENSATFYMNKKSAIEDFILNFDVTQKKLIAEMDKQSVSLSANRRDNNCDKIPILNGSVKTVVNNKEVQLSCQELKVLYFFTQGASYKEIARIMDISDRTVETYLQRIRIKCGLTSNAELYNIIKN